jgi:hypothetical protein
MFRGIACVVLGFAAVAPLRKPDGSDLMRGVMKPGGKAERLTSFKDREVYDVDLKDTKTSDMDLAALSRMKGIPGRLQGRR